MAPPKWWTVVVLELEAWWVRRFGRMFETTLWGCSWSCSRLMEVRWCRWVEPHCWVSAGRGLLAGTSGRIDLPQYAVNLLLLASCAVTLRALRSTPIIKYRVRAWYFKLFLVCLSLSFYPSLCSHLSIASILWSVYYRFFITDFLSFSCLSVFLSVSPCP